MNKLLYDCHNKVYNPIKWIVIKNQKAYWVHNDLPFKETESFLPIITFKYDILVLIYE